MGQLAARHEEIAKALSAIESGKAKEVQKAAKNHKSGPSRPLFLSQRIRKQCSPLLQLCSDLTLVSRCNRTTVESTVVSLWESVAGTRDALREKAKTVKSTEAAQ
eukprot:1840170-Rhodomonas_salina.1